MVKDSFSQFRQLLKQDADGLSAKGFKIKNQDLYKSLEGKPDLKIIYDLERAKKLAQEAHKVVEDVVRNCTSCQFCTRNSNRNAMAMQVIPRKAPFVTCGMDFVDPLPRTLRGNQYLVTAIDYGTGWAYAVPLHARSGLAKLVKSIIENHSFPHSITTDNGSEFTGKVYEGFLAEHNIKPK